MLNTSQHRRHIVKKITVNHIEPSRKMSKELFDHAKLHNLSVVKNCRKVIAQQLLQEYLHDSSVHGMKYFSNLEIKPGITGKLFWTLIMICSFVCK